MAVNDATQLFNSAKRADDSNDFKTALGLYLKADSAFIVEKKLGTAEYAQSLHNTGRAFFNVNNFEKGREYTLEAANLRAKLFGKVSKEYITSLNNYALSYLLEEDPKNALKIQTEVVELCREMNPAHPDEGMYLINLGRVYHALNDDDNAIIYLEEALPKVEKFGTNYEYILNFLGMVYMERNDNTNANRILGLMDEHNQHELTKECNEPKCHLERAQYYQATGNPAKAKDEYMAVFTLPLTNDQKIESYRQYARYLAGEKDFKQAAAYFKQAAEISLGFNGITEDVASLLYDAGVWSFIGRDFNEGIADLEKVVEYVDRNHYPFDLKSKALLGLGNSYCGLEQFDKAKDVFKRLVQELSENGHSNEEDLAKALERLAVVEKFNKDYEESISHYEKAIELYGALGLYEKQQEAKAGLSLCRAYAGQNTEDELPLENLGQQQRNEKLNRIIEESKNSLEQSGGYLGKLTDAQVMATIAGCYSLLEDYDNSVNWYFQYIPSIREALAEDFLLKNPIEREATWQNELSNIRRMDEVMLYIPEDPDLYGNLSSLMYDGQLISKGILLSSNVEFEKVMKRFGTDSMRSKYETIKKNLSKLEAMRSEGRPVEDILALSRQTELLQLELARESAEYSDFMNYLRITSDDVMKALPDDAVAIEFITVDTGDISEGNIILADIITKDIHGGVIPIASERQIKTMISDKKKFGKEEYGELIWKPILDLIPGTKKIFFAPDGQLNNIGIEYLSFNGRPLSDQFEVSRLSSTREIAREHKTVPLLYASLFGDIDYIGTGEKASSKKKYKGVSISDDNRATDGTEFGNLEETGREVEEIDRILKKHVRKTFLNIGVKASKPEFLSLQEFPVSIIHVATHGKYIDGKQSDTDAMKRSLLAFAGANMGIEDPANNGIVTADDISKMSLHDCDLVVLSACESGIGKLGDDGVFGLQRGFKNAGARTLLVSLKEVADMSTADMMIAFYRNLFDGSGMTKREALRRAQAEIRDRYPDDDTWASFILIDSFN